jgi:hypothetical protein
MKYWLIIFFFSEGEFVGKREIAYKDEATCYIAMDYIRPPVRSWTTQMVCVSDDHFMGRKQDKNVPYD